MAPVGSSLEAVEAKLKPRCAWIVKQQSAFERYLPTLPARQYVSGETHLYWANNTVGRVVSGEGRDRLCPTTGGLSQTGGHHRHHQYPELRIRTMQKRWGSCRTVGVITLNLKLIQAPKLLIDYVIIHELCHLKEHNHSPAYDGLLDRVMPNWPARREALNQVKVA